MQSIKEKELSSVPVPSTLKVSYTYLLKMNIWILHPFTQPSSHTRGCGSPAQVQALCLLCLFPKPGLSFPHSGQVFFKCCLLSQAFLNLSSIFLLHLITNKIYKRVRMYSYSSYSPHRTDGVLYTAPHKGAWKQQVGWPLHPNFLQSWFWYKLIQIRLFTSSVDDVVVRGKAKLLKFKVQERSANKA